MKVASSLVALLSAVSTASAFVAVSPGQRSASTTVTSSRLYSSVTTRTPELQVAIAEVRECAASFSDETSHFANLWIDKMVDGTQEGMAAGLLEECLIDDDSEICTRYETALKKLDSLLGIGAGEQY